MCSVLVIARSSYLRKFISPSKDELGYLNYGVFFRYPVTQLFRLGRLHVLLKCLMVEVKKHSTCCTCKPGSRFWWVQNDKAFFKKLCSFTLLRYQNSVVTVLEISYVWTDGQPYTVFIDGTGGFLLGFIGSGIMPIGILTSEGTFFKLSIPLM